MAPNKGSSGWAQSIIVVLCPKGLVTSDVQGRYHLCGCGQLTSKPMDKGQSPSAVRRESLSLAVV